MKDDVLGTLQKSERFERSYEGTVKYLGKDVNFVVDPDDVSLEEALGLARKIIRNIGHYEKQARAAVCKEYLSLYNDGWRHEEDPVLTAEQFAGRLQLTDLSFHSDSRVDAFYSEDGMFGWHSLIAESSDGETFSSVTMFG